MNENTESQVAPETTEAEASTNSADASLDYEALYHQEIKNSKKQRAAKQDSISRLETLETQLKDKNEAELMQQGKHEEIIAKQKAEIASLKVDSETLATLNASRRESLLSDYTDEEREKLQGLDNDALELLNSRTMAQSKGIEHPKGVPAAGRVSGNSMTLEELNKMDPKDRQANWAAFQNQFTTKP